MMPAFLQITVRFLQPLNHGRGERGEPEWPPSPLRLFQALVAASATRWGDQAWLEYAAPALRRLESLPAPTIVAPVATPGTKYRLYVPDNVADKVAATWSRGGAASIADYRTEKDIQPLHLREDDAAVHYLWELPELGLKDDLASLFDATRSITHLGWGIDMVAAEASIVSEAQTERLSGMLWLPTEEGSPTRLRVPVSGTLSALISRHEAFLNRIDSEGFNPVQPLTSFQVVGYRLSTDPSHRPNATFRLVNIDGTGYRPFDSATWGVKVAGMLRHAIADESISRSLGWPAEKVARFVLGHGEPIGHSPAPVKGPRLAFIPLPTIAPRGRRGLVVESIRRVLITVLNGDGAVEIRDLERLLLGVDLISEQKNEPIARLAQLSRSDNVVGQYCGRPSPTWATVTPVILPGFDDPGKLRNRLKRQTGEAKGPVEGESRRIVEKLDKRVDELLRKAIRQAGFSDDLARFAEIEWRSVGFWPGTEHAIRYVPPKHLERFRRLHVRITWRDAHQNPLPISGPICLGGGRFCGLGLFAAVS